MRQANNNVYVTGYLGELALEVKPNASGVNTIMGSITVRVPLTTPDGQNIISDIPFSVYVAQLTKAGKSNPAYESMNNIMTTGRSIAMCDNLEEATKVSIHTNLEESFMYVETKDVVVSFPRLRATFVNIVTKDFKPQANWETEFVMGPITEVCDKDGIPVSPARSKVTVFIPGYGDRLDQLTFTADNPGVLNAVNNYWQIGESYKAHGYLRYTVETVNKVEESGFGDAVTKSYTNRSKEIVITGGSDSILPDGLAWEPEDIKAASADRKNRMEAEKEKKKNGGAAKQTMTAAPKTAADKAAALGF